MSEPQEPARQLQNYHVQTSSGHRNYYAEDSDHAREQHIDAFASDDGEEIIDIHLLDECPGL